MSESYSHGMSSKIRSHRWVFTHSLSRSRRKWGGNRSQGGEKPNSFSRELCPLLVPFRSESPDDGYSNELWSLRFGEVWFGSRGRGFGHPDGWVVDSVINNYWKWERSRVEWTGHCPDLSWVKLACGKKYHYLEFVTIFKIFEYLKTLLDIFSL